VGKPEGRIPLGRPRRRWEDNIKMDLWEVGWGAQTGLIWLRTGTGCELFCIRWWTLGFHKMRGISWVAYDILASQEGLCSMELVSSGYWSPGRLKPFLSHCGKLYCSAKIQVNKRDIALCFSAFGVTRQNTNI
jgi:hypothetical protein